MPASQVLKIAGGSRTDFADLHKSEIITSKERILVDLAAENVEAMVGPGDTLYVPLAEAKISVTGAVEKPGQYVITEPVLLGQAIAMAGGFNEERANPKKMLTHAGRWGRRRTGLQSDTLGGLLAPERSAQNP